MNDRSMLSFAPIRRHFELPDSYPADAEHEAQAATDKYPDSRVDARDIEFVTIDPAGSLDLDQAVCIQRLDTGYRLHYAIADVGAFVTPGGALDREVHERGQTIYLPDGNVPLHPRILSEQRASLNAGEDRPAVWWQIDTDAAGHLVRARVCRAHVHVRERFDYETLQAQYDRGEQLHPAISLLPEWAELRASIARERGAIELQLPEQDLEHIDGHWQLRLQPRTSMDAWNAQCSLTTGMVAAEIMIAARMGIIRTLPSPSERTVAQFQDVARSLGVTVGEDASPGDVLASCDPNTPEALSLHTAATKLLRGAGYATMTGELPDETWHAGVGARYAHATAPLRRLVDRYSSELCLAITDGAWVTLDAHGATLPDDAATERIPNELLNELEALPGIMQRSGRLAADVDNSAINLAEAVALQDRIGEVFTAVRLRGSDDRHLAEVYVPEPPVIAQCAGAVPAGERIEVRLTEADPARRRVRFVYPAADAGSNPDVGSDPDLDSNTDARSEPPSTSRQ